MRKYLLLFFAFVAVLPLSATLNGDGFYRVKNAVTQRYISVIDNKGRINTTSTSVDLSAIKTIRGFNNVVSDPGSIVYIQKVGDQYRLYSQGTDTYTFTEHYLSLRERNGQYYAYATSGGLTKYLADYDSDDEESVLLTATTGDERLWEILPVDLSANYFGFTPSVAVGSQYYQTFYASFAYTFSSSATKAYYISKVDGDLAVMKELSGMVAPATPVIIASS